MENLTIGFLVMSINRSPGEISSALRLRSFTFAAASTGAFGLVSRGLDDGPRSYSRLVCSIII
jgi:hypothetical protein